MKNTILAGILAIGAIGLAGPAAAQYHDGCSRGGQACVCGNTQWAGFCGTGQHKAGLYCQCDDRPVHHDNCAQGGQSCTCANTGWGGSCQLGPHKSGLYCRCD